MNMLKVVLLSKKVTKMVKAEIIQRGEISYCLCIIGIFYKRYEGKYGATNSDWGGFLLTLVISLYRTV